MDFKGALRKVLRFRGQKKNVKLKPKQKSRPRGDCSEQLIGIFFIVLPTALATFQYKQVKSGYKLKDEVRLILVPRASWPS